MSDFDVGQPGEKEKKKCVFLSQQQFPFPGLWASYFENVGETG
jgi:hypothetical protein